MIVGYARTSTTEQVAGFEAQDRDLRAAGVERIFAEQVSSVGERVELEAAIGFVRQGDVFTVTKLDRWRDRSPTCWRSSPVWRPKASPSAS